MNSLVSNRDVCSEHSRSALLERLQGMSVRMLKSATVAMAVRNPAMQPSLSEIAGGCVAFSGSDVPLSCAVGVATNGVATSKDDLDEVEAFYRSRNSAVRIVVSERSDSELPQMLRARGYEPGTLMQNWWLPLEGRGVFRGPDDIEIVSADLEEASLWVKTVAAGFLEETSPINEMEISDTMLDTFFCLGFADGAQPFFAKRRGLVVGGGVLHLNGETASIRTTSCRIEHRNQGVQSALLAFRLNEALKAGCRFAFSSTAHPGPSARNLHRFGFTTLSISQTMCLPH